MRYKIKNWHDYQHYKDRCPPWIKLHHSLLTNEVWVMGNDACRVLVVACMLLAARNDKNDGTFNGDPEYLKRFAYLNTKPDFKLLLDNGFIELVQDASTPLAECNTEQSREETEQRRAEKRQRPLALPNDYIPKDSHFELASKEGVDLHREIEVFRDHWIGNGEKRTNWDSTLNNWIRRAAQYAKKHTPSQTRADQNKAAADQLTGRSKPNATRPLLD